VNPEGLLASEHGVEELAIEEKSVPPAVAEESASEQVPAEPEPEPEPEPETAEEVSEGLAAAEPDVAMESDEAAASDNGGGIQGSPGLPAPRGSDFVHMGQLPYVPKNLSNQDITGEVDIAILVAPNATKPSQIMIEKSSGIKELDDYVERLVANTWDFRSESTAYIVRFTIRFEKDKHVADVIDRGLEYRAQ
ncbi:MAG: hypothetical protein GX058_04425, partial [Firmicutes bacterium]|nr:hypothetical protein [Bacillota bacterium]